MNRREFQVKTAPVSQPAYIRIPRPGERDPLCGLTRSQLHDLVKRNAVKSVSIKQPGKGRGIRLISVPSLLQWVESQAA